MKRALTLVVYCWSGTVLWSNSIPKNLQFHPDRISTRAKEMLYSLIPPSIQNYVIETPTLFEELKTKNIFDSVGNTAGPNCHALALGWHFPQILKLNSLIEINKKIFLNRKELLDQDENLSRTGPKTVVTLPFVERNFKIAWQSETLKWDQIDFSELSLIIKETSLPGDLLQIL